MNKMSKKINKEWVNVTEYFSEEQRNYNGKYLEIDEVYDDVVEVSYFSSPDDENEIYVSMGIMYGITYVHEHEADEIRNQIKAELEVEYKKNGENISSTFINNFAEKYRLCLPNDMFFSDDIFDF